MTSQTPFTFSKVVSSTSDAGKKVCEEILSGLKEKGFGQEDIFAVHLAVEEAFSNSIEHGNKMDPDKNVRIDCLVNSEQVEISLTDEGAGFDPDSVPDPRDDENLYKTSGRGLLLIRTYMDQAQFNDKGNVCLLYTSPSPRDATLSRMPSSA